MNSAVRSLIIGVLFLSAVLLFENYGYSKTNKSAAAPGVSMESNPRCLAINPITGIAVAANMQADSVSVVDLTSQSVLSTIEVGEAPRGMAIHAGLNRAVVGNNNDNTLSIIDLDTCTVIRTIPVGAEPEGIAIDQSGYKAVVANHKNGTVSVIDLIAYNVITTVPVGKEPIDVAIDPEIGVALVANEKDSTVSVVDLNTYHVAGIIRVGQMPRAIDLNPETHIAVVADEKDNAITVIDLKTWNSTTIPVGKHPIDVAVNPLDNRAVVICDEDRTLLLIDLNTNTVIKSYALNKLPKGVAVNSFTNTAGVVDDQTDSLTLIQLPNPVPEISSITPDTVLRGSNDTEIVVEGDKFITTSTASINLLTGKYDLDTVFIDNHHVKLNIKDDIFLEAGKFPVTIYTTSPDGGTSNSVNLTVNNPVPSITALQPSHAMAGAAELTLTVSGLRFFNDTIIFINGVMRPYALIDPTKIQLELSGLNFEVGAYLELKAANPSPGGGLSTPAVFTVFNPVPELTSMHPQTVVAGSPGFTLSLTGDHFVKTSAVSFNGCQLPTRYLSGNQIEATMPAEALKTPGNYPIKVINPIPEGGETSPLIFAVKPSLDIKIAAPANGDTINKAKTMVRGSFKSETRDVGVTVNGVIAEINGNEWIANEVPLVIGENTIAATVKEGTGNSAETSITINTTDITQWVRLSSNLKSGIAPLTTYFSVTTELPNPVTGYQMDFEGDGVLDYTGSAVEDISYTYSAEGVYYPTVTVTDNQGNTYSDTIAITVMNKEEIDALLKGKWEGMKGALTMGDIEGALNLFTTRSKERYRIIFSALKDQLPIILGTFVEFNIVNVYDIIAEYELVASENGKLYSYPGVFIKGGDGIWKFKNF